MNENTRTEDETPNREDEEKRFTTMCGDAKPDVPAELGTCGKGTLPGPSATCDISQEIQVNDLSKRIDYIRAHHHRHSHVNPRDDRSRSTHKDGRPFLAGIPDSMLWY